MGIFATADTDPDTAGTHQAGFFLFLSPSRRLNGNWLAEAGFSTDTPVMVSVEQGRLVIEPVRG
ncbi:MAG: type I toxin-antitoxin system SymE family toxin [Klebsiella aerogenes]|nr:type I toxin-antitoxin system SymE family toxin [Klebsiella aerogenes]